MKINGLGQTVLSLYLTLGVAVRGVCIGLGTAAEEIHDG
ncbi:MAG: hypothetical protein K0Q84_1383 [Arthrobacter sp.]|jgi:hypothetical protein|nr:hypothetical protein [Arthrobacter sp.]